ELLGGERAWEENYALAQEAHVRLAEGLCLVADYQGAFAVIERALAHAVSIADRAKLYAIKTNGLGSMGQVAEALACGRAALEGFGMELPEDAARAEQLLQAEIGVILERTAKIGIENLLNLPVMQDADKTALMALMTNCLPNAYQTNQQLFALICCKMVS